MNSIKILGIDYQIIYKTPEEINGLVGLANFNTQEIWVNNSVTAQTQKIAVWHEIIHIISEAYGLGLSEEQVKIGTHALIAFASENPEFKQ